MSRFSAAIPAATILIFGFLLAGCTSGSGPDPAPPVEVTPSVPEANAPLACADFASEATISAVLTGSDGTSPTTVVAVQPSRAYDFALLNSSGGLGCSWRAGEGQTTIGTADGDWAYLSIEVLPGGAPQWTPPYLGDVQSTDRMDVAGVSATTAGGGETGWTISAPVGDAWVQLMVKSSGMASGESRFAGAAFDQMLDQMLPAAEEVFTAVQGANAVELSWPQLAPRDGEARCDGGLAQQGIESALQLDGAPVVSYEAVDSREKKIDSLADAVNAKAGVFDCKLSAEGLGYAEITVVRHYAPVIEELGSSADSTAALEEITLDGAVDGELAYRARREDGPQSPLFFTVGETLYRIYSDGATVVAEAIIAQTR